MSNTTLFASSKKVHDPSLTTNSAGGIAYKMSPEHALANYAFCGTLHSTFYTEAKVQLSTLLDICGQCSDEYIAQVAIASRQFGLMKDAPSALLAVLNSRNPRVLSKIFNRVVDNGKILKNFVQIVRSGTTTRRGFGTVTKRVIRRWIESRSDWQLMQDNIGGGNTGKDVSLEDVLRLVRPRPQDRTRSAMYAWLRGAKLDGDKLVQTLHFHDVEGNSTEKTREYNLKEVPDCIIAWESYKLNPEGAESLPKVPFQMLTSLPLGKKEWIEIARQMSWQQLRQNLSALSSHGVFDSTDMIAYVSQRLRDPKEIANAKVFPYSLLSAYLNTGTMPTGTGYTAAKWRAMAYQASADYDGKKPASSANVPQALRDALRDAMEIAIQNVPTIPGQAYLCVDVSGSMQSPVTGYSAKSTCVRCVDVAGLFAAAILRRNPDATVLPFNTQVLPIQLRPMDNVMANAEQFVRLGGGGTSCSAPLAYLNARGAKGDLVIFISDNESHCDSRNPHSTAMMQEWKEFKTRNPRARLVCIDLTPKTNAQVVDDPDTLLIGGFSDHVFQMIADFASGQSGEEYWVKKIKEIELN